MDYPEYLCLFENNGEYRVHVKFKDFDGEIADRKMHAKEISKFVNPETGTFYEKMFFDDYLFEIRKYEIDPVKKTIKIKACMVDEATS